MICLPKEKHEAAAPKGSGRAEDHVILAVQGDVGRLWALGALLHVVLNLVALVQRAVARGVDSGEVSEDVGGALVGLDEAVALVGVEPLNGAGCHVAILRFVERPLFGCFRMLLFTLARRNCSDP